MMKLTADLYAKPRASKPLAHLRKHWVLYAMLVPAAALTLVFKYWPMYGLQIAFREYNPAQGFSGSPWVGLKHFQNFFASYQFERLLGNTLLVGLFTMLANIPAPILLGLSINSARRKAYGKAAQFITYAPYFISTVIIASIVQQFLAMHGGIYNTLRGLVGLVPVNLLSKPEAFRPIYVISEVWQKTGYGAVIYIAALSAVSPELYEAARIDGASTFQRILYIDLPSIASVAIIQLVMNAGSIINVGYEKVLLLQNQLNLSASDVINTYVYRIGILSAQSSYSSAIGLFNSVVSVLLLVIVNFASRKLTDVSLF